MSGLGESASQSRFMTGHENQTVSDSPNVPLIDNIDAGQIIAPERKSWKNLFVHFGPGFLVSIVYIDPGNVETDLQSGAQYKCELLWIMLVASCTALFIQSLATKLGVVTGTTFFSIQHWFCVGKYHAQFMEIKIVLGKRRSKLFAIALLASSQSSTITGTYAGQYVM